MDRPLIGTKKLRLGEAPALFVFRTSAEAAAAFGTVLFYHGFTGSKLTHLREMRRLSEAGFLVVGVDAVGHGERQTLAMGARLREARSDRVFAEVVLSTLEELPGVVDRLSGLGLADPGRLGIVGVSMGGFIAYAALLAEPRLVAAAAVVASPRWPVGQSPHWEIERFFPKALLSITAERDKVVPPIHARELHAALAPRYKEAPERLRYLELPGAGHILTADQWRRASAEIESFLERFVASAASSAGGGLRLEQKP